MPNGVRLIEIDCSKFCECKIALTFLRTPDFAFDGVPCTQAKFAYLIGRYINIIRASKIIGFRTAQKTKAVGQDLNGAKAHDLLAIFRSEEHTSELQSLMRISYAVFCLNKKQ